MQLFSSDPEKWSIHSHYGSPIVPLFATACVCALIWIPNEKRMRLYAASGWLALTVAHGIWVLPSPVGPGKPIDPSFIGSPREVALRKALSLITGDDSVCTQDNVLPHLADRIDIHEWPDGALTDDFILIDQDGPTRTPLGRNKLSNAASRIRVDPAFSVLIDDAGVLLAKRKPVAEADEDGPAGSDSAAPSGAPSAPAPSAPPPAPTP